MKFETLAQRPYQNLSDFEILRKLFEVLRNYKFASHLLTMKITRISVNSFFSEEGKEEED